MINGMYTVKRRISAVFADFEFCWLAYTSEAMHYPIDGTLRRDVAYHMVHANQLQLLRT